MTNPILVHKRGHADAYARVAGPLFVATLALLAALALGDGRLHATVDGGHKPLGATAPDPGLAARIIKQPSPGEG